MTAKPPIVEVVCGSCLAWLAAVPAGSPHTLHTLAMGICLDRQRRRIGELEDTLGQALEELRGNSRVSASVADGLERILAQGRRRP